MNQMTASINETASTLHLPPGDWSTVLDCLCSHFPAIDRIQWRNRMDGGRVLDGAGQPVDAKSRYAAGLRIQYFREVPAEQPIPFVENLLHVDEHLVVADKPHFLPVIPAGRYVKETLLARLIKRLGNPDLVPLHRIDRGTAGLVLFSSNPATRAQYQALFQSKAGDRRMLKRYHALAPALPEDAVPSVRRSRVVAGDPFFRMHEVEGATNSETHIRMLDGEGPHRLYQLQPVTGRKHQLRVHMAAIGAPILNDRVYPDLQEEAEDDYTKPLQLLAHSLAFTDPLKRMERRFESGFSLKS